MSSLPSEPRCATRQIPADIVCADDYARRAAAALDPRVWAYLSGGSGAEQALRANRDAFARISLYPRLLRPGRAGHTGLSLLGQRLRHPFLLAPVAQQGLLHGEAESATARAAAATDSVMVVSTRSTLSLESIATELPQSGWFQLYFQERREHSAELIRRAEQAGYGALVVTLDAAVQALPRHAQRLGYSGPAASAGGNFAGEEPDSPIVCRREDSLVFQGALARAPSWDDLVWLRAFTRLPLLVKGVMHPDDASRLLEVGIDALVVSNHGGRTLDAAPASLIALARLREQLGPAPVLLLDGGVRSGSDAFKALALGANAVLIGRPYLHALAVAGALGVAHLIRLLRTELEVTMAQTGCQTLAEIGAHCLFDAGIQKC